MPRVICNSEHCLACRACELACAVHHAHARNLAEAIREQPCPVPRVRVSQLPGGVGMPLRCMQCQDPPCVLACMSGGLRRDPHTGVVTHDPDRCVGCWMCVMVCPFGGVQDVRSRGVVLKCDLCEGEDRPACVAACPTRALSLEEAEQRV